MRSRTLLLKTLAVTIAIGVLKLIAHLAGLEIFELSPLFTALIGGAIFLFGLILSGTLADYKELDKVPAEVVSALESIRAELLVQAWQNPKYDRQHGLQILNRIAADFMNAVVTSDYSALHTSLSDLNAEFATLESHGTAATYLSRLRNDQSTIKRQALRTSQVQHIDFLPSAYMLLMVVVVLVLGILVFIKIEPIYTAVILTSFVTFLFIYLLQLIQELERPFRAEGASEDDVSMFLVHEFLNRVAADIAQIENPSGLTPVTPLVAERGQGAML